MIRCGRPRMRICLFIMLYTQMVIMVNVHRSGVHRNVNIAFQ